MFDYKGRTERVTSDTEQDLTNAIIKVVSGQQRKIYFTQGHGEKDTTSPDRDGYNAIADALGRENYSVDKVVIAQAGAVPDDASVVVAAGPRIDFFPNEIEALKNYLGKTGKLLLEIDPPDKPDSPPLTNLIALAHDWGMDVGNNIVVDASGMGRLIGTDASVPVVANYPPHPITERFNFLTAFPLARSVTPVMGGVNGHTAQTFARDGPAELGGSRHQAAADDRRGLARRSQGRQEGPGLDRRRGLGRVAAPADPPKPGAETAAKAGDAGRRDRRLGFRRQRRPRHPGQPRPVHEHDRMAVAAGEPHRDPAEGARRPADHADGDAAEQHPVAVAADHSRLHLRRRASTPGGGDDRMRGLRSTIALIVVLGGLGAYIYFVTWKKPAEPASKQEKVFAGVRRPTRSRS